MENSDSESRETNTYRANQLKRSAQTDFSQATDIPTGDSFLNLNLLEAFISKHFPHSTALNDIKKKYPFEKDGCRFSSDKLLLISDPDSTPNDDFSNSQN